MAEREAAQVAKRRARDEAAAEMELRKAKDAMERQEKLAAVARAAAVAPSSSSGGGGAGEEEEGRLLHLRDRQAPGGEEGRRRACQACFGKER